MAVSAIILSGGRSSRFGGVHKPGVSLGGRTVVSRIVEVVRGLDARARIWLAGSAEGLDEAERIGAQVVVERPRFSGPLAAISAAMAEISALSGPGDSPGDSPAPGTVLVLAGDMPLITVDHLRELAAASRRAGTVATALDEDGKLQYLCAAWPTALLEERLQSIGDPRDKPVRLLFEGLTPVTIAVDPTVLRDFDTPEDFARIERLDRSTRIHAAAGGRAVPGALLALRDRAREEDLPAARHLGDEQVQEILDFASRIKHSTTELSPVLAAFLAGSLYGREPGAALGDVLDEVERLLTRIRPEDA